MYCAQNFDTNNGLMGGKMFDNKEDAVAFLLDHVVNVDRKSNDTVFWTSERNGKLYGHTTQNNKETYDELFDYDNDKSAPRTFNELRNVLLVGKFLNLRSSFRDSLEIKIAFVNTSFYGYQVLDEKKTSSTFDDFNGTFYCSRYNKDEPAVFKQNEFEFLNKDNNTYVGFWTEEKVNLSNVKNRMLEYGLINEDNEPVTVKETQYKNDDDFEYCEM